MSQGIDHARFRNFSDVCHARDDRHALRATPRGGDRGPAADPLSVDELRKLGVGWISGGADAGLARDVFVSRLHVRYDAEHFPEDLGFQETGDRQNFQGRYVLRHPWNGAATCEAAVSYRTQLGVRQEQQARTLARLTGWRIEDIRRKMGPVKITTVPSEPPAWSARFWNALSRD